MSRQLLYDTLSNTEVGASSVLLDDEPKFVLIAYGLPRRAIRFGLPDDNANGGQSLILSTKQPPPGYLRSNVSWMASTVKVLNVATGRVVIDIWSGHKVAAVVQQWRIEWGPALKVEISDQCGPLAEKTD